MLRQQVGSRHHIVLHAGPFRRRNGDNFQLNDDGVPSAASPSGGPAEGSRRTR